MPRAPKTDAQTPTVSDLPAEVAAEVGDVLEAELEAEVATDVVGVKEMRKGRKPGAKGIKRFTLPDALKVAAELRTTRLKAVRAKKNLSGDEAVEWGKQRLMDMVPEAVADLQFSLKYGTAKERAEARERVLRANGLADKEAPSASGGMVILNLGGSLEDTPFLKRALEASPSKPVLSDPSKPDGDDQ